MKRSIARSDSPAARRFSMLRASAAPARKTKVGGERCVIQGVKNCAAGSGMPGWYMPALSAMTRPALNAPEAWSIVMRTMTTPRSPSSASSRPPDVVTAAAPRRTRLLDRPQGVRDPALVGVDRGQNLQIARPSVERDQAEPELLLRTLLEEIAPPRIVVLSQSRMADGHPRGLPPLTQRLRHRRRREGQRHPEDEGDHPSH